MGRKPTTALVRRAAGLEFVRAAAVFAVDETHEIRSNIAVVVKGAVCIGGDVPARGKDEEVGKRGWWVTRLCGQDAEDTRVNVVNRDGSDVDKLGEIVLVRDIIAVPGNDVEWTVLLGPPEELAAKLVDNLPAFPHDLVLGLGMEEVSCVRETVRSQWPEFRKLKVGVPNLQNIASRGVRPAG